MRLQDIKTEVLVQELINRISDQLQDPEPQYDGILSYLDKEELDTALDELIVLLPMGYKTNV